MAQTPIACSRRTGRILLVLVIAALALRMILIVGLHRWRQPGAMEHAFIAQQIVEQGQFNFSDFGYFGSSSVQSPPYPLLLAGLFRIFGIDSPAAYFAALTINAIVGALTVWLIFAMARAVGAGQNVALLAAGLFVIWPTQVYAVSHAQAISLITAAVCAMILLFYSAVRTGRSAPWIGFSLIGTLAALTEPVLLPPMALTGILILFWRSLPVAARLRNAAILLGAAIVVIGPWTVRNRLVHGQWIPIKSTFWVNVWKGNNPSATGTDRLAMRPEMRKALRGQLFGLSDELAVDPDFDRGRQYATLTPGQLAELNGRPDAQREALFAKWSKRWISENPGEYLRLCLIRLGKSLWVDLDNPKSWNWTVITSRSILLAMTVIGLPLALWRRWSLGYPLLIAGACLLTYTLTIAAARFALPLEPMQLCLTALVVCWAWDALRGGRRGGGDVA